MIRMNHCDGQCYKLTIIYTDYGEGEPFEPYVRYSEDFEELLIHGNYMRGYWSVDGKFIMDFRIQDDSK